MISSDPLEEADNIFEDVTIEALDTVLESKKNLENWRVASPYNQRSSKLSAQEITTEPLLAPTVSPTFESEFSVAPTPSPTSPIDIFSSPPSLTPTASPSTIPPTTPTISPTFESEFSVAPTPSPTSPIDIIFTSPPTLTPTVSPTATATYLVRFYQDVRNYESTTCVTNIAEIYLYDSCSSTTRLSPYLLDGSGEYYIFSYSNCFDGDTSTFCHSVIDTCPTYLDMYVTEPVTSITIINRQDGSQERMVGMQVLYYSIAATGDQTLLYSSTIEATATSYELSDTVNDAESSSCLTNIAEIYLYDSCSSTTRLSPYLLDGSGEYYIFYYSNCFDGDTSTFCASMFTCPTYLDMYVTEPVASITIVNREDCCQDRMVGMQVLYYSIAVTGDQTLLYSSTIEATATSYELSDTVNDAESSSCLTNIAEIYLYDSCSSTTRLSPYLLDGSGEYYIFYYSNCFDGDTSTFCASMFTCPTYLDMYVTEPVASITIVNREDCCQDRMVGMQVLYYSIAATGDQTLLYSSTIEATATSYELSDTINLSTKCLTNIAEIYLYGDSDTTTRLSPYLLDGSGSYESFYYSNCFDGDTSTFCHSVVNICPTYLDMYVTEPVTSITIINRQDCCQDRMVGMQVLYYSIAATGDQTLLYSSTIEVTATSYELSVVTSSPTVAPTSPTVGPTTAPPSNLPSSSPSTSPTGVPSVCPSSSPTT
eukprot:gene2149-1569_t